MPGLFGIYSRNGAIKSQVLRELGTRMANAMQRYPWLRREMWNDDSYCGGRVFLDPPVGEYSAQTQQRQFDDPAFFDGRVYDGLGQQRSKPTSEELWTWCARNEHLRSVDGLFQFACYDAKTRELFIANDRLGYRPLYIASGAGWFAYAAEVKAILAVCEVLPAIDQTSLMQFISFGWMFGNRTWWDGISSLSPASVLRVCGSQDCRNEYWSFDDINYDPIDESDAEHRLKELWSNAVELQAVSGTTPLLLSGGLDSRALLAELTAQGRDVLALTFSDCNSDDASIASRITKSLGISHHKVVLDPDNWWHGREDAIWQTDGMVSATHLHVVAVREWGRDSNRVSPMNLAGDLIFGGSYLGRESVREWQVVPDIELLMLRKKFIPNPWFTADAVLDASRRDVLNSLRGPSTDCFWLRERVGRFTIHGPGAVSSFFETVYPSVSLPILELVYGGLTDRQRQSSRFYDRFLLRHYSNCFPLESSRPHPMRRCKAALKTVFRGRAKNTEPVLLRARRNIADYKPLYGCKIAKGDFSYLSSRIGSLLDSHGESMLIRQPNNQLETASVGAVLTAGIYLEQAERVIGPGGVLNTSAAVR